MLNFKALRVAAMVLVALGLKASYIIGPTASPLTPTLGTPGFVQTTEAHSTGAGLLSASFGSLPAINNIVVVGVATAGGGVTGNLELKVSDNQGNAYSQFGAQPAFGISTGVVTLWCSPVLVSSGTFTVSADGNSVNQRGILMNEYSHANCNPDRSVGAASGTSPYSCSSLTTKNAKDLLLTFLLVPAIAGTVTFTAPASFTLRNSQPTVANGLTIGLADDIVSSIATYTPTFAASQNVVNSECAFAALLSQ